MGTGFLAMGAGLLFDIDNLKVLNGQNPVSVMSHGMASMPGMDPHASTMLHNFGSGTDAMLPPENRAYPIAYFPPPQVNVSTQSYSSTTHSR